MPNLKKYILGEKRVSETFLNYEGWNRRVSLEDGTELLVVMEKGSKRIRIAYKPRGAGAYGFHWYGKVITLDGGRSIFDPIIRKWVSSIDVGRVSKSIGCKGILEQAGLINA